MKHPWHLAHFRLGRLRRLGLVALLLVGCAARRLDPMPTAAPSGGDAAEPAGPADAWRLTEPSVVAAAPTELPRPATFSLANEIAVVVQPQPRLPLFAAAMMFGGGSASDPIGKEGLAAACLAAWLPERATYKTELVSALLADLGANMTTSAGDNYSLITLRGPAWHMPQALTLWQHVALSPSWLGDRAETLARVKARLVLAVRKSTTDPEAIASRLLRQAVLGDAAARTASAQSVARITAADCEAYQARYLRADNLAIVIAGDVEVDDVHRELERQGHVRGVAFADLPRQAAIRRAAEAETMRAAPTAAAPHAATPRVQIVLRHVPEASQTHVALGQLGVSPAHAAFLPTLLAMQALGGGGGGRLVAKLREATGFGYYAKFTASSEATRTLFGLQASVEPGAGWLAANYMLHERNKLVRDVPVAHAELAAIVANRTQLTDEALASPTAWVMAYVQVARLGLDMAYLTQQVRELAAITPNAVRSAMQQLIDQPMVLIVVGDAEAPQYAPALISGWEPRLVRMRGREPVTLRQALAAWAAATGAAFRELAPSPS